MSLILDGTAGVNSSGPVVAADGTVSLPGIAFGSDLDNGAYRIGTNNWALAVGGAKVVDLTTAGVAVTGTLSASGAATLSSTLGVTGASTVAAVTGSGVHTLNGAPTLGNAQLSINSNSGANTSYAGIVLVSSASSGGYLTLADASNTGWYGAHAGDLTLGGALGVGIKFRVNANDTTGVSIGTNGIVTMAAYGAGTATFSAAGVISSVSDETWKTKDGVPTNPDAMLQKLAPGYWYYNDEKKETFGTERQLGFYAQNVNAAIGPEAAPEPETVTTKNEDGTETSVTKPWGYYDRSVLAVTVMSLQKALATIESLTARITALEAK
jgi:hypothetical protein